MSGHTVAQFSDNLANLCQCLRSERRKLISILLMRSKREHLARQAQELDAILVVPSEHLDDISGIGQTDRFDILLASLYTGRLLAIGTVLGWVFGLIGVAKRVSVFQNRSDTASSRSKDRRCAIAEIGI